VPPTIAIASSACAPAGFVSALVSAVVPASEASRVAELPLAPAEGAAEPPSRLIWSPLIVSPRGREAEELLRDDRAHDLARSASDRFPRALAPEVRQRRRRPGAEGRVDERLRAAEIQRRPRDALGDLG